MQIQKISLFMILLPCASILGHEDSSKAMANIRSLFDEAQKKPEQLKVLVDVIIDQQKEKTALNQSLQTTVEYQKNLITTQVEQLDQNKKTISRLRWMSITGTLAALGLIVDKINTRYPELLPRIAYSLRSYLHSKTM